MTLRKKILISTCVAGLLSIAGITGLALMWHFPNYDKKSIEEAIENSATRPNQPYYGMKVTSTNVQFPQYIPKNGSLKVKSTNETLVNQGGKINKLDTSDTKFGKAGPFSDGSNSHFIPDNSLLTYPNQTQLPAMPKATASCGGFEHSPLRLYERANIQISNYNANAICFKLPNTNLPTFGKCNYGYHGGKSITPDVNFDDSDDSNDIGKNVSSYISLDNMDDYNTNFELNWTQGLQKSIHYKNDNEKVEFYDNANKYIYNPYSFGGNNIYNYSKVGADEISGYCGTMLHAKVGNKVDNISSRSDTVSLLSANYLNPKATHSYHNDGDSYKDINNDYYKTTRRYKFMLNKELNSEPTLSNAYQSITNAINTFQHKYVSLGFYDCNFDSKSTAEYLNHNISNNLVAKYGYVNRPYLFKYFNYNDYPITDGNPNNLGPYGILEPDCNIRINKLSKTINYQGVGLIHNFHICPTYTLTNNKYYTFNAKSNNPDIPSSSGMPSFKYHVHLKTKLIVNPVTKSLVNLKIYETINPTKDTIRAFRNYNGLNKAYLKKSTLSAELDSKMNMYHIFMPRAFNRYKPLAESPSITDKNMLKNQLKKHGEPETGESKEVANVLSQLAELKGWTSYDTLDKRYLKLVPKVDSAIIKHNMRYFICDFGEWTSDDFNDGWTSADSDD